MIRIYHCEMASECHNSNLQDTFAEAAEALSMTRRTLLLNDVLQVNLIVSGAMQAQYTP